MKTSEITTLTIGKDTLALVRAVQQNLNNNTEGIKYNTNAVIRWMASRCMVDFIQKV